MSNKLYKGVVVPAVTPLTIELKLDEAAVENMFTNFYHYNAEPFILGTTGEAASMPLSLKHAYILKAGQLKKSGTHLYAGISSTVLQESIDMAKACADAGVDVVVATVPSYYALNETQLIKYFESLADSSPLPLIIYNIPATTHVSIALQVIDNLSQHSNIVGMKDSERSAERLKESIDRWKTRNDFSHFVGWAAKSADALIEGSDGIIPSTGNLFPGLYCDMLEAVQRVDLNKAHELQNISDLLGSIYQADKTLGESLWALKVLMKEMKLCDVHVMPPLQPLPVEVENELLQKLESTQYKSK